MRHQRIYVQTCKLGLTREIPTRSVQHLSSKRHDKTAKYANMIGDSLVYRYVFSKHRFRSCMSHLNLYISLVQGSASLSWLPEADRIKTNPRHIKRLDIFLARRGICLRVCWQQLPKLTRQSNCIFSPCHPVRL